MKLNIPENFKDCHLWLGGIKWTKEDKLDDFLKDGIWKDGYDIHAQKKHLNLYPKIKPTENNYLLMKKTRGSGKKATIHAIGHIIKADNDIDKVTGEKKWRLAMDEIFKIDPPIKVEFDSESGGGNWSWTLKEMVSSINKQKVYKKLEKANMSETKINFKSKNSKYTLLLESNRQIILCGSPGTGKTYTAKKIAQEVIQPSYSQNIIIKETFFVQFVQFHPSFDYVDFIEGLKPDIHNGQMTFKLKNGIFKEFCRKAGVIERAIFKQNLTEKSKLDKSDLDKIKVDINNLCKGFSEEVKIYWETWFENNTKEQEIKNVEDFVSKIPKFVFIIDEINRADLSKVFGELMYCLEPDYRGWEGKVKTQYCGLNSEETCFIEKKDDWFFIPSNAYIIGTMNDIDRSVEFFDFALRRRFVWEEIKASDVMNDILAGMLKGLQIEDKVNDLSERAKHMNSVISDDNFNLNHHYHIGPAYFGKIKNYCSDKNDYEEGIQTLFKRHIEPLLKEYVRGTNLEEKLINDCRSALGIKDSVV